MRHGTWGGTWVGGVGWGCIHVHGGAGVLT